MWAELPLWKKTVLNMNAFNEFLLLQETLFHNRKVSKIVLIDSMIWKNMFQNFCWTFHFDAWWYVISPFGQLNGQMMAINLLFADYLLYIPFFKHIVILSLLHSWYPFTLLCCFFNNLFLKIFFMCTILKVYWVCYNIAAIVSVLVVCPRGLLDLSSLIRNQIYTPYIGRWSLNRCTAREVSIFSSLIQLFILFH